MAEFLRNAETALLRAQANKTNDLAYVCESAWAEYYWHSYLKVKGGKYIRTQISEFHELLEAKDTERAIRILSSVSRGSEMST